MLMALTAAILTLLGVLTGVYGTYLMTMAINLFDNKGVVRKSLPRPVHVCDLSLEKCEGDDRESGILW